MKTLRLERSYSPFGVWGRLHLPSGLTLATLERPWEGNRPFESCIPEGVYECRRINSPKYGDCFEVTDIYGRNYILLHAGNGIEDSTGCILIGQLQAIWGDALKVSRSKAAMKEFFAELEGVDSFELSITTYSPEYP